jgi:predicted TIM-barrel fold metal-dependent hydrolase
LGDCLAALERWPHLYLETSRLAQFRGVETVVRGVGAQRLLFGSAAPSRPVQAMLNAVVTAEIPDEDKCAVLATNAGRLFGLPAESFRLPTPTHAERLIDVHTHIGSLGYPTPPAAAGEWMARHDIARSYASSLRAIAEEMVNGNADAFAAVNERVHAYVVVNPNDLEGSCLAMDAAYKAECAFGAKLHCQYSGVVTASRACLSLVREVARRGRPLKIHVDGDGWDDALADVAAEYPTSKIIVAHGGPGTPSRAAGDLIERTSNVYVELCSSFPDLETTRELVRRAGPDRLLFGSDAPLLDPAYVLGIYADARADLARTTDAACDVFGQR